MPIRRAAGRSHLFSIFRRATQTAREARLRGSSDVTALAEISVERRLSRRRFLKEVSAAAAALSMPAVFSGCSAHGRLGATDARVAVVGGGLAGLYAARVLRESGVPVAVYEASNRVGGRVFTGYGTLGEGSIVELGGEFADSTHSELLGLWREYGLETVDTFAESERGLHEAYYFKGRRYTEAEILREFAPIAERIDQDLASIGDEVNYRVSGGAAALDNLSVSAYLSRIGASGWIRELLEVAYVSEYGLDADVQSCLNLLFLISTDTQGPFQVYGESDERFKLKGGNGLLGEKLAADVADSIQTGMKLEGLRHHGKNYQLLLGMGNGAHRTVEAEIVILAVPFSILRNVSLDLPLSAVKQRAIRELGYGTNAKLLLGFQDPVWRKAGYNGNLLCDGILQAGWDCTRLRSGSRHGYTLYFGGAAGVAVGEGAPHEQAVKFLAPLGKVFPGAGGAFNGTAARFHWPSHPFSRGSYSAYTVGQWTTIAGAEGEPEGNLFFAGEHCSEAFQGFMNGALETGKKAAEAAMSRLGVKPAKGRRRRSSGHLAA